MIVKSNNQPIMMKIVANAAGASGAAAGGAGGAGSAVGVGAASGAAVTEAGTTAAVVPATVARGPLIGVQGLVGGAMNTLTIPLNTITGTLGQLGIPTIATAPISSVSSFLQQAGSVYGR